MKITNKKYKNINLANEEDRGENLIIDFIISSILGATIAFLTFKNFKIAFLTYILVRFLYYIAFEYLYSRTPGKYQTQTIVVNLMGQKPTSLQLIKRNLSRFVSILSGISDNERALHDNFSNTFVIKNTELKKVELKKPSIFILNLLIYTFWISYIGFQAYHKLMKPTLETFDIVILIGYVFGIVLGIRSVKVVISEYNK